MSVKDLATMAGLLEKNQQKIFFDHYAQQPSLFNWDKPSIPEDIVCRACNGIGEVGRNVKKLCGVCNGNRIPPIPNFEIYGPENASKVKK